MWNLDIFILAKERLSTDIPEVRAKKRESIIKNRAIKTLKIIEWISFVAVVIILSLCFYLIQPINTSKVVFLPSGSVASIISYINSKGIDINDFDRHFLRVFGYPQKGWIDIGKTSLSKWDFFYRLTHAKAAMVEVTLIPGETLEIFLDELEQSLGLDKKKMFKAYKKIAPYPDGVIFPETYYVPMGISEEHLIYYLVNRSLTRHEKLSKKFFGVYNQKKWFRYVTIASIIQKEAADKEEMPLVSSVIYNRLKKRMPLQMDGALNYGKYSHIRVTKDRIREDNSHFNTYKFIGLPPTPVGSASIDAIKAAIKPLDTDYLYFVKGKDGRHIFTKSYKMHLKAIKSGKK